MGTGANCGNTASQICDALLHGADPSETARDGRGYIQALRRQVDDKMVLVL